MLGLPASTEIRKVITKKKVYERFETEMSAERRKSFDADVARITLVNEISPISVNIPEGENVKSFFVILIALRKKDYDKQNIAFIAKMFGQKLLLIPKDAAERLFQVISECYEPLAVFLCGTIISLASNQ